LFQYHRTLALFEAIVFGILPIIATSHPYKTNMISTPITTLFALLLLFTTFAISAPSHQNILAPPVFSTAYRQLAAKHFLCDFYSTTPGSMLYCSQTNFEGICTYVHLHPGQCLRFTDHLNKRPRSFSPDPKTSCQFYLNTDCSGMAVEASYNGGRGK
jgi:hypothetical protein